MFRGYVPGIHIPKQQAVDARIKDDISRLHSHVHTRFERILDEQLPMLNLRMSHSNNGKELLELMTLSPDHDQRGMKHGSNLTRCVVLAVHSHRMFEPTKRSCINNKRSSRPPTQVA